MISDLLFSLTNCLTISLAFSSRLSSTVWIDFIANPFLDSETITLYPCSFNASITILLPSGEYAPSNPQVHQIRFEKPTEKQLKVYQQRILEKHVSLNPSQEERHIICMINIAFELKGLNGWADFYFQDVSPQENPSHNQITYQRLTRDLSFQKKLNESCWN